MNHPHRERRWPAARALGLSVAAVVGQTLGRPHGLGSMVVLVVLMVVLAAAFVVLARPDAVADLVCGRRPCACNRRSTRKAP
jgi:hypothetical protein